jgi:hypothetical protein
MHITRLLRLMVIALFPVFFLSACYRDKHMEKAIGINEDKGG